MKDMNNISTFPKNSEDDLFEEIEKIAKEETEIIDLFGELEVMSYLYHQKTNDSEEELRRNFVFGDRLRLNELEHDLKKQYEELTNLPSKSSQELIALKKDVQDLKDKMAAVVQGSTRD